MTAAVPASERTVNRDKAFAAATAHISAAAGYLADAIGQTEDQRLYLRLRFAYEMGASIRHAEEVLKLARDLDPLRPTTEASAP